MQLFKPVKRLFLLLMASTCLSSITPASAPLPASLNTVETTPPDTLPGYPGRNSTSFDTSIASYTLVCTDSASVPHAAFPLWRNMQTLRNSGTLMGPLLYDHAEALDIYYGFSAQKGSDGLWSSYYGTVRIDNDKDYTNEYRLLCQVHETVHGIQNGNGVLEKASNWSIWDMQRACMSTESAALVSEYLVALDFYHSGKPAYINEDLDFSDAVRSRLLGALKAAEADSLPYAADLATIGEEEFYSPFKQQWWLDYYNNWTLDYYLSNIKDSTLRAPGGTGFTLDQARQTGALSAAFNFTAGIDSLPGNLFGKNARMKQAFEYAECVGMGCTLGTGDSTYIARLETLKKNKNPYVGIDLMAVYAKAQKSGKPVFDVLENAAKHLKTHPAPVKPALKKATL